MNLHLSSLTHLSNKPGYLFISSFPSFPSPISVGSQQGHFYKMKTSLRPSSSIPPARSSFQVKPGSGPSLRLRGLKQQFQSWKQQSQRWDVLGAVCNQPQRWSRCTWNGFGAIMDSGEISTESEAVPEQFPGRKKEKKGQNAWNKLFAINSLPGSRSWWQTAAGEGEDNAAQTVLCSFIWQV